MCVRKQEGVGNTVGGRSWEDGPRSLALGREVYDRRGLSTARY